MILIIKGNLLLGKGFTIDKAEFVFGKPAKEAIKAINSTGCDVITFDGDVTCKGGLFVGCDVVLVEGNVIMYNNL